MHQYSQSRMLLHRENGGDEALEGAVAEPYLVAGSEARWRVADGHGAIGFAGAQALHETMRQEPEAVAKAHERPNPDCRKDGAPAMLHRVYGDEDVTGK